MANEFPADSGAHSQPLPKDLQVVCPECDGKPLPPRVFFASGPEGCRAGVDESPCDFCEGTGKAPYAKARDRTIGRQKREERIARREGLMEAATRMGVSPAELSAMEYGRKPWPDSKTLGEATE